MVSPFRIACKFHRLVGSDTEAHHGYSVVPCHIDAVIRKPGHCCALGSEQTPKMDTRRQELALRKKSNEPQGEGLRHRLCTNRCHTTGNTTTPSIGPLSSQLPKLSGARLQAENIQHSKNRKKTPIGDHALP
jgi:hypothetical protein